MNMENVDACPLHPTSVQVRKEILTTASPGMGVFECDDCRQTSEARSGQGVTFRKEPDNELYGVEAIFEDPFGNWFSMTQRK